MLRYHVACWNQENLREKVLKGYRAVLLFNMLADVRFFQGKNITFVGNVTGLKVKGNFFDWKQWDRLPSRLNFLVKTYYFLKIFIYVTNESKSTNEETSILHPFFYYAFCFLESCTGKTYIAGMIFSPTKIELLSCFWRI